MSNWPKHADGRNKKFGELTPVEQRAAASSAAVKLQAEADDPNSGFSRTCTAILHGPDLPRSRH